MPSYDLKFSIERYPNYDNDGKLKGYSWGCPDLNLMGYGCDDLEKLLFAIRNNLNKMMGKDLLI